METKTLIDLFKYTTRTYSGKNLLYYRDHDTWKTLSTDEFRTSVEAAAAGLMRLGVKRGDNVGIISNPSPYWVIVDHAIQFIGAVTVPIFRRISSENLEFEIRDSDLKCIFVGDENEYAQVMQNGPGITHVITIGFTRHDERAITFEDFIAAGRGAIDRESDVLNHLRTTEPGDLATIIYTSGSMGIPKGVKLTHANIVSQVLTAGTLFPVDSDSDIALTSLPLSHIFERMVMYYYLYRGLPVYFVDDLTKIGDYVREIRPTIMTVVPRLLEKIFEKMKGRVLHAHGIKKIIGSAAFNRAMTKDVGIAFSGLRDSLYKKLVYTKLSEALGGRFKYVISGSASMPVDIGRFFMNIGLPLFEGYGMTEASPVITANRPGVNKLGTVGQAFGEVEIRISSEGEILARGPNVMMGYHNNPEMTDETLDADGFLHTGDLGKLDGEGFLTITGRKKELFKKSTGEYVSPVPIEQALTRLDIVDMAVVIADNRRFVSALLFPNFEIVQEYLKQSPDPTKSVSEFLNSDFIKRRIQEHVAEVNRHVHHSEEVSKYTVITTPISIETGEITPTMKLRRKIIEEKFRKEIELMYT